MDSIQLKQTAERLIEAASDAQIKEEYEKSMQLANEALPLFEQLEDEEAIFELKSANGVSYVMLNRIEEGLNYLTNLEEEYTAKYGYYHRFTLKILQQLTYLYLGVLKKIEKGIVYAQQCLEIHLKIETEEPERLLR